MGVYIMLNSALKLLYHSSTGCIALDVSVTDLLSARNGYLRRIVSLWVVPFSALFIFPLRALDSPKPDIIGLSGESLRPEKDYY